MTHEAVLYIHEVGGKWQCYRTVNGLYKLNVGPAWPSSKEAMAYAKKLDAIPIVSPLRGRQDHEHRAGHLPGSFG